MIVVDTSVLSGALERKRVRPETREAKAVAEFRKLLRSKAALAIPGVVLQEVLSRIADREILDLLRVRLQGLTLALAEEDDHVRAAEIANDCLRSGVAAATVDCLIAATTVRAGAKLLTTDPDFADMAPHCGLELHPF